MQKKKFINYKQADKCLWNKNKTEMFEYEECLLY